MIREVIRIDLQLVSESGTGGNNMGQTFKTSLINDPLFIHARGLYFHYEIHEKHEMFWQVIRAVL